MVSPGLLAENFPLSASESPHDQGLCERTHRHQAIHDDFGLSSFVAGPWHLPVRPADDEWFVSMLLAQGCLHATKVGDNEPCIQKLTVLIFAKSFNYSQSDK